jgi:hypothetical protein
VKPSICRLAGAIATPKQKCSKTIEWDADEFVLEHAGRGKIVPNQDSCQFCIAASASKPLIQILKSLAVHLHVPVA